MLCDTPAVCYLPLNCVRCSPMQVFGPVRSCRLVVYEDSGKLKGTAFVDFYRRASAQLAAEACAKGRCAPGVVCCLKRSDGDLLVLSALTCRLASYLALQLVPTCLQAQGGAGGGDWRAGGRR